jgi:3-oxoacyl-[acyl-carrier protein] reductase
MQKDSRLDLDGRRCLVTGGSRGIGAATAKLLARCGADVAIGFDSRASEAAGVVAEIEKEGRRAVAIRADVAVEGGAQRLVEDAAAALSGLDLLVNNAGIWTEGRIEDLSPEQWDREFAVNCRGTYLVTHFAVPSMKQNRFGRIVNVSSTAGQRGEARHSHYAATKGAIISLTKSLAAELGPDGIIVNCVAPGWVETDMSAAALADPRLQEEIRRTVPRGRAATAEEVAGPIVFLLSDWAAHINGEVLNVNGGSVLAG